MICKNENLA